MSRAPSSPARRAALAAAVVWPLAAEPATGSDTASKLVALAAAKNAAFIRGDMQQWADMTRIAPDFTLMQPFGGPASHGFDARPERLAQLSRYFRKGVGTLEVVQTCVSDSLAVLVFVERQRGEVGGLPDQDWSLRVTEVYRKTEAAADGGAVWELLHRHADPLVHKLTLDQAASLARGLPEKVSPAPGA